MINGAGGGVGTFAIQMARADGVEVTAVDRGEKLDLLRTLGADEVIDYTRDDFTRLGPRFDLILDVKASRSIFAHASVLRRGGRYVALGGSMPRLLQALLVAPWLRLAAKKRVGLVVLKLNQGLDEMKALFEAGTVVPVIDRPFELSETAEAFRLFLAGGHKGKLVVTVAR